MSHAVLLMITNTSNPHAWDEMMEPYEESAKPQYRKKEIVVKAADRKANMLEALHDAEESLAKHKEESVIEQERAHISWIRKCIHEEEYEEFANEYHSYLQDEDGNWYYECNPHARWDWWMLGGRWPNMLKTKDGKEVDVAKVKDIEPDCLKNLHTYAVMKDGKWFERAKMGWWAITYVDDDSECMCAPEYITKKQLEEFEKDDWVGEKYKEQVLTHINHLYVLKDDRYELPEGLEVPDELMKVDFFREAAWRQSYYERFIKDLDPETYLVIIDYHI